MLPATLPSLPPRSTLYCADAFAKKSQDWLMAYPWVSPACPPAPCLPASAPARIRALRPPRLAPRAPSSVTPASRRPPPAHPQVAYCAPYLGGMSQANCGKCLRMTNGRTGSQVIVRIVDMCGHGGAHKCTPACLPASTY